MGKKKQKEERKSSSKVEDSSKDAKGKWVYGINEISSFIIAPYMALVNFSADLN